MKQSYKGPPKPIPVRTTYFNPMGLFWLVLLLCFLIGVLLLDLFYWRPA